MILWAAPRCSITSDGCLTFPWGLLWIGWSSSSKIPWSSGILVRWYHGLPSAPSPTWPPVPPLIFPDSAEQTVALIFLLAHLSKLLTSPRILSWPPAWTWPTDPNSHSSYDAADGLQCTRSTKAGSTCPQRSSCSLVNLCASCRWAKLAWSGWSSSQSSWTLGRGYRLCGRREASRNEDCPYIQIINDIVINNLIHQNQERGKEKLSQERRLFGIY